MKCRYGNLHDRRPALQTGRNKSRETAFLGGMAGRDDACSERFWGQVTEANVMCFQWDFKCLSVAEIGSLPVSFFFYFAFFSYLIVNFLSIPQSLY